MDIIAEEGVETPVYITIYFNNISCIDMGYFWMISTVKLLYNETCKSENPP